ncbi:D-arabinono-1,4-lactone oxidase, partial [Kibdelosporangium lantanae]
MTTADDLVTAHDHMEFYWFPYGRKALVKRNDRLPLDAPVRPLSPARRFFEYTVMENTALAAIRVESSSSTSLVPTWSSIGGNPVRSPNNA